MINTRPFKAPVIGFLLVAGILAIPSASMATTTTTEPPPPPVDDRTVGGSGDIDTSTGSDSGGAGVEVTDSSTEDGSGGTTPVSGTINWEAVWNNYCLYSSSGNGSPYVEGATVSLIYVRASTTEGNGVYRADCNRADGGGFVGGEFDLPDGAGLAPVDPIALRDRAAARIDIVGPNFASSPPFDTRHAVVHLPTWFWVTDPWDVRDESDSEGGLTVRVLAEPVGLEIKVDQEGQPQEKWCEDPTQEWTVGVTDIDCEITFVKSSAGQPNSAFAGTATVVWEFTWELNGVLQGTVPFAVVDGVTDFDIEVGEIQAVGASARAANP